MHELEVWQSSVSALASAVSPSEKGVSLSKVACAGSALLRRCEGRVEKFVAAGGSSFFSPHVDVSVVRSFFGDEKKFPQIEQLIRALCPGAPVAVAAGGCLEAEVAYGNHSSISAHTSKIMDKIVSDVTLGRALVFDTRFIHEILGLRVSPLGVVEEPKFRIIHDLTFAAAGRTSVNADTDFGRAPECLLGHVLFDILSRILFLRQLHGESVQIMLCRVDVREAFRQVVIDPSRASVFGYVMGDVVVVDLRAQFGWRSSPGFWSLFSSALEHSHTHTTFQTASVSPVGAESVKHVKLVPPSVPATPLPRDCATLVMDGGFAGSAFFVRYYVDDGVLVEARFFRDGRRCLRAVQSIASDHFRLLGTRGPKDPPLLSSEKITDLATRLEVLGWILDTQQLTVTMPAHKQQKLARVLSEWPATRTCATTRQVSQLTGFLIHVCFALRPGKFFVGRLLAAVGMPQSAVFPSRVSDPNRRVVLGPLFHDDLEFWRWFVAHGLASRGGSLCSPMYNIVHRPPKMAVFSDASKTAFGGYCEQTGLYFRRSLTADEQSRFVGSSKMVSGVNDISINVLELLGMVVGAQVLITQQQFVPQEMGDCIQLRGDNEPSVAWIQRCRGGKEPRSGALMRLLGVVEVSSGWTFQSSHVPGVLNSLADGISRWHPDDVHTNLCAAAPTVQWQEVELNQASQDLCSAVLGAASSAPHLRLCLKELTWACLGAG